MRRELGRTHPDSRVRFMMNDKSKFVRGYSREDVTNALLLKMISNRAFRFVRSKRVMPMPSITTQRRWVQDLKCRPGFQEESLQILREVLALSDNPSVDTLGVLVFGQSLLSAGGSSQEQASLQMVVVQGLCTAWKEPIYLGLDTPMSKDIMLDCFKKVEEGCGVKVKAIVFDPRSSETTLANLGSQGTPIEHPLDPSRTVHLFPDAACLLMDLRKDLLGSGFDIPLLSGERVHLGREAFVTLIEQGRGAHGITPAHLLHTVCDDRGTTDLRMADELLSLETARALFDVGGEAMIPHAEALEIIRNWYDVFSSGDAKPSSISSSCSGDGMAGGGVDAISALKGMGFGGSNLDRQTEALANMEYLAEQLKVPLQAAEVIIDNFGAANSEEGVPRDWQVWIRISIRSLQDMHAELRRDHQHLVIFPSRLSLHCLQSFFVSLQAYLAPAINSAAEEDDVSDGAPVILKAIKNLILAKGNGIAAAQDSSGSRVPGDSAAVEGTADEDRDSYLIAKLVRGIEEGLDSNAAPGFLLPLMAQSHATVGGGGIPRKKAAANAVKDAEEIRHRDSADKDKAASGRGGAKARKARRPKRLDKMTSFHRRGTTTKLPQGKEGPPQQGDLEDKYFELVRASDAEKIANKVVENNFPVPSLQDEGQQGIQEIEVDVHQGLETHHSSQSAADVLASLIDDPNSELITIKMDL